MKTLFQPDAYAEITARLDALRPDASRQWGQMNAAQMFAHCANALEVATGQKQVPRRWLGRLLGPFFKSTYLNDQPLSRNSPTDPHFVVADEREFDAEKTRLAGLIARFYAGGEAGCTTRPHSFFGKFTPQEWSRAQYKHLDHHFRQFSG